MPRLYRVPWIRLSALLAMTCWPGKARAQGNYEIQVYGADTVEPKSTMKKIRAKVA